MKTITIIWIKFQKKSVELCFKLISIPKGKINKGILKIIHISGLFSTKQKRLQMFRLLLLKFGARTSSKPKKHINVINTYNFHRRLNRHDIIKDVLKITQNSDCIYLLSVARIIKCVKIYRKMLDKDKNYSHIPYFF